MANELSMLLSYLLIVFIWSAECSQNQREEYFTGGVGERKIRVKRAIGGTMSKIFGILNVGTLWSDTVIYRDAFADSRFYGMGTVLHPRYILVPKPPLETVLSGDDEGNFWDKHIQFGDELTHEYYQIEKVINVKEGVRLKGYKVNRRRQYGLKYISDATKWFSIAERKEKGLDDKGWEHGVTFLTSSRPTLSDCYYVGWSQQLQNGTKKADTRYFVKFPVRMTNNSCSDHVCQFDKSDGLPGGFCNSYQESGSMIWCEAKNDVGGIYYIVVQDPERPNIENCTGRASAYHVPHLMGEVKKVLFPGGYENDSDIHDELRA